MKTLIQLALLLCISFAALGQATHLVFINFSQNTPVGKLPGFNVYAADSSGRQVLSIYTVTLSAPKISGTLTATSTATGAAWFGNVTIGEPETITASSPGLTSATINIGVPPPPVGTVVPANYFGMHVLSFQQTPAPITFATARSWDATNYYGKGPDWADTNPSPGVFNWTAFDEYMLQMQGKDVVYDLGRTPLWASTNPTSLSSYGPGQAAPPTDAAWQAWVKALVAHAGTRIYYEIWNEPNYSGTWNGTVPQMAQMATEAYAIIHTAQPSAIVLSPAAAGTPGIAWMQQFVDCGGAFDVLSFHGYTYPAGIAEGELTLVNGYKPLAAGKPMWDTEAGWNSTTLTVPQEQSFLAKAYLLQFPAVSRFIWYAYDGSPQWGQMWTSAGQNAVATAYAQVQSWMVGSTMTPCVLASGVYTCQLGNKEAVWIAGSTSTVPAGSFTQYRDLNGFIHPITTTTVPIGDSPILLESQ